MELRVGFECREMTCALLFIQSSACAAKLQLGLVLASSVAVERPHYARADSSSLCELIAKLVRWEVNFYGS